jgi:hypothetical protein
MVWRPVAIMRGPLRNAGRVLDLLAVLGLAGLGALCWRLHYLTPDGADPWLFRGGFLVTGLATLLVIAAVTHRYSVAGPVLGNPVFKYVGTRSYGLYLFHWPIYQVIRKLAGNVLTWQQFAIAMAVTLVITELSYTYVETPVRRREVAIWWDSLRRRRDPVPRQLVALSVVAMMAIGAFGVIRMGVAENRGNAIAEDLERGEGFTVDEDDLLPGPNSTPPPGTTPASAAPASSTPVSVTGSTTTTTSTTSSTTTTLPIPAESPRVFAIGDSVMQGAADVLAPRGWTVFAQQSLQMADAVPTMERLAAAGTFDDTEALIIHLGTNGDFSQETLDALLAPVTHVPNVLIYTIRANRSWTASNNAMLRAADNRPNVVLIDWEVRSNECANNCFAGDGIHLNATGKEFYADLARDWTGV